MLSIGDWRADGHRATSNRWRPISRSATAALTVALVLYTARQRLQPHSVGLGFGLSRPRADHVYRVPLQAVFLLAATTLGRSGDVIWVVLMVLVFLTWGELYVLFPAVLADFYGSKNSALNYSFLYSAKGFAALLGSGIAATLVREDRHLELCLLW